MSSSLITADAWFASGQRVLYNTKHKTIVDEKKKETIKVFEKIVMPPHSNSEGKWLTMLPGFPTGSFGFSKIESLLQQNQNLNGDVPRLYVEYVGQGNSDKPKEGTYLYNTIERANLVEALWKAHNVKTTIIVSMDFSSLVMLELLARQKAREAKGIRYPRMEHVLSVNGSYFADGHAHTGLGNNTPLIRDKFGSVSSGAAQRSDMIFKKMLSPLFSAEYRKAHAKGCRKETKEILKAVRLHQGARIMAPTATFIDEHKQRADRWNLRTLYGSYCTDHDISFHILSSERDPFEAEQTTLVKYRMKEYSQNVRTERLSGGYFACFEQADKLVSAIVSLVHKAKEVREKPQKSWAIVEPSPTASLATTNSESQLSWTSSSTRTATVDYGLGSSSSSFGLAY